ncbi:hypothetical protein Lche_2261 [Legionella cherrii]|uniref:Uncharacterized protein n=1 Tax=Legionella cherrii TaxID=28084 RepID=A0A0W0SAS5_9GAMM|nr:hypothetical protein [Legionella cherrii]KTC80241.1 hypothetical protein Lche_2261 [Legionella cherrii]
MTKVRGPKDGKIVTASFDSIDKKNNSKSFFPTLKTTKNLVLLSIRGNEYCTGEYLAAIVNEAVAMHQTPNNNSGTQGKTTFLIADEIYWHNLKKSSDDERDELKQQARGLGESYFERNLAAFLAPLNITPEAFKREYSNKSMDEQIEIINQLAVTQGKNFEIMRWQTWESQNDFKKTLEEILPLYNSLDGLKIPIEQAAADFAKRHLEQGESDELWHVRSRNYLAEESPSIMLLAASLGYNFITYPGNILPPFKATKEFFVVENHVPHIEKGRNIQEECYHDKHSIHVPQPHKLVNWLEVNFKRSHDLTVTSEKTEKNEKPKKDKKTKNAEKIINLGKVEKAEALDEVDEVEDVEDVATQKESENVEISQPVVIPMKTDKLSDLVTFFSPRKHSSTPQSSVYHSRLSSSRDEGVLVMELSSGKESPLQRVFPKGTREEPSSALPTGVSLAVYNESLARKKKSEQEYKASPLSQIFQGITQGVMSTDLPMSEKIGFLTELVDKFMERERHYHKGATDTSLSLSM